jgi:GrpB-like predicted nucleotidyltransferase (UPF0157 family)
VPGTPDPIVEMVPYSPDWPARFAEERAALADALDSCARSIEHIGSTAVPGLAAKPTIDILVVADELAEAVERLAGAAALDYQVRPDNTLVGSADHVFLRKVHEGKRTHHLHLVRTGSAEIDDYRRFRDALRDDPALTRRYERLKLDLAAEHHTDRMGYVTAKSVWVEALLASLREHPR